MSFKGQLYAFQEEAVNKMVSRQKLLVGYQMGLGKALSAGSRVFTPHGEATIGSLRPGDEVLGRSGRFTRVVGVFPQGMRELVEVYFSDGSVVRCDWEHLWTVVVPSSKNSQVWRTYSTRELYEGVATDRWGHKSYGGGLQLKNGNNRYQIPMVKPVEWRKASLKIDPYLLGLLLGDGSFANPLCVRFTTADEELRASVESLLPPGSVLKYSDRYDYRIRGVVARTNPVLEEIRALGLAGHKSESKFIPDPYLYSSVQQRLALLQGLLDTDGHVRPIDNNIEYSSVSKRLIYQVQWLVQSLGGIARVREKPTPCQLSYRMSICLPNGLDPFRLIRKRLVYRGRRKYLPCRSIVSINPCGRGEAVCIAVDAEDQLYVTDSFVVTHNTVISIAAAERLFDQGLVEQGLVIAPASVKYQWARMIREFTTDATCIVIDGTPSARMALYQRVVAGEFDYVIMNYDQIVNDWEWVRRIPRDLVILDEATAIKNFKPKRSKRVKKLDAEYKWALTGQPIENKAEEVYSIMQWVDPTVLGPWENFDKLFVVRNHWGQVRMYKNLPTLHRVLSEAMVRRTRDDVRDQLPSITEESLLIDLDVESARLYRHISKELEADLSEALGAWGNFSLLSYYTGSDASGETARGKIMSKLTCLRMLCDNPDLLRISAEQFGSWSVRSGGIQTGSSYAYELLQAGKLDKRFQTPKLDATLELLEEIMSEDPANKVVLFSFFKHNLRLIGEAAEIPHVFFTGDMDAKQREASIERFRNDRKCRLFLSSDAGGIGVDLPMANYLVSYNLPWSAGKWEQRLARIIRLSSKFKGVTLLSTLIAGSVEERQYDMLRQKQRIADAVIDGKGHDSKGRIALDLASLASFLRGSTI